MTDSLSNNDVYSKFLFSEATFILDQVSEGGYFGSLRKLLKLMISTGDIPDINAYGSTVNLLCRLETTMAVSMSGFSFPHLRSCKFKKWYAGWMILLNGVETSTWDNEKIWLVFCLLGPNDDDLFFWDVMKLVFELVEPLFPIEDQRYDLSKVNNLPSLLSFFHSVNSPIPYK